MEIAQTSSESDLIFVVNRNADEINITNNVVETVCEDSDLNNEGVSDDYGEIGEHEDVKILCIVWKNGKMGAAYYNVTNKLLYSYEEMMDTPPEFPIVRLIYREIKPKMILTFGNRSEEFVTTLIEILEDHQTSSTVDSFRNLPPNLFLLSKKDYSFELCRTVLSNVNLATNPQTTSIERELHLNSLIVFEYKLSVYAMGALIKYLDKNWVHFIQNREELQFLDIEQISIKNHLLIDSTTLSALQVFQQCSHEARFKRGLQSSNREGLSVFKLFSANCRSKLGQSALKNILLNPINDKTELTKRLDFIGFVLHPAHQEFIESLHDKLKNLVDINLILLKIESLRANASDWKVLYKAFYQTVFINELSAPYVDQCALLHEFRSIVTAEVVALENSINNAIDFSCTKPFGRPVIKYGLDQELDAKKLRRNDIAKHVKAAAHLSVNELPRYIQECSIVYLPEMGHLIAIKEWSPGCNPDDLQALGFQFMFILRDTLHYKNPICLQLDQNLGDINAEIIAHETRILQRLSSFVIKYQRHIRRSLHFLSQLDALISMAKAAAQNDYTRPHLNCNNLHEIESCRHPLLELVSHFEPNDFASGRPTSLIKVITGPNGSGKSIYLKQVGLVVYFAHIGSYVPARRANIGMMHSIHSRMQATEAAAVRLSAFMIDVVQTTQALHTARANSLVLLDEFGRGTIEDEGFALLLTALRQFYERGELCPHVVVSTHFQKVSEYLEDDALVEHLKMEHTKENNTLFNLYKISAGVSASFAFDIAEATGLDLEVVDRARGFKSSCTLLQPLSGLQEKNEDFEFARGGIPDVDLSFAVAL